MKCLVSWVTQDPKLRPTTQCQVGLYFLSNSFLMQAAISFSMLNFQRATLAQSMASCCISSFMSACLITAFLSAVDIYQLNKIKSNYSQFPSTPFKSRVDSNDNQIKPSVLKPKDCLQIVRLYMLTIDRQLKNKATVIELKSATSFNQRSLTLEKLGGAIQASITRLKQLRIEIQVETNLRVIAQKMVEYQKANNQYNQLQKSLAEVDDSSEIVRRIKSMNKQFIETYDPQQLQKKLNYMKAERTSHLQNDNFNGMNYLNDQEQLSGELLYADKHAVRKRMMEQQRTQLVQIERLINQVKDIADKTRIMINEQGVKIEISLQKMQKANRDLKLGKENLFQTNQYQQDTNKKMMIFCCLTVVIVSIVLLIFYSSRTKN